MKPYGQPKRQWDSDHWKASRARADREPPTADEWDYEDPPEDDEGYDWWLEWLDPEDPS